MAKINKIAKNNQKNPKITKNYQNSQKLLKINQKLPKITKTAKNCQK